MRKLNYFIFICVVIAVVAFIVVRYLVAQRFPDMLHEKSVYIINALDLIKEFEKNDSVANAKYAEKIMTVKGTVTGVETAGSTTNIKIGDTITGSYAIFAFQQRNLAEAKTILMGDEVAIKGSCSGGGNSKILDVEFITFNRCVLDK